MDVNYILIKGNKHFKCHSLAEMAIYFSLSVTSNGSVICDGYHDTMSYSIDEYVAYNKVHNLFFDENTDADLLKAREKLATKIANVQEAEERLKIKIEKLQKGNNYVGSKK